ncbi:pyridoxamine 5'-phosphate oxidase family protein [Bacillus sp. S/N-304-OC-R1]|uniref:pyridoxamine 5'-phosphate oxidase family protein n=1 Tax=Bacillus sp. S/N-304-OC-R1 TaxID=2758034 RepID=UPI0037BEAE88
MSNLNQEELKKQVVNIISNQRTGVLATVENNKPHSRYMTFFNKDLTLYTPTKADTEKLEELKENPAVSVLLGFENKGLGDTYVQISGTSSINDSQNLKKQYWDESFNKWFDGPEDPNYVFLEIKPEIVRVLNNEGSPPQELQL